jgi:hypothetical protein
MTAILSAKDSFGCDRSDLLVDKSFQVNALKFHLKRGRNSLPHQVRNLASSDDHLLGVSLSDNHYRTVWHSSHSERHKFNAGDIYLRTLDSDYSAELTGSFNFLLIEIDAQALAQMSQDTGMENVSGLRRSIATADMVLGGLAAVISLNTSNELLIESASLAISNHLCATYGIYKQRKSQHSEMHLNIYQRIYPGTSPSVRSRRNADFQPLPLRGRSLRRLATLRTNGSLTQD